MVVDLGDPELWQDPYPVWRHARRQGRTACTAKGEPILLAAGDLDQVHADEAFGQLGLSALERLGIADGPFHAWRGRTMAAHDGPVHARLKGSLARSFTPRRVEPLRTALRPTPPRSSTASPHQATSTSSPTTPRTCHCG